jgi:hypothetical protein
MCWVSHTHQAWGGSGGMGVMSSGVGTVLLPPTASSDWHSETLFSKPLKVDVSCQLN